MNCNDILVMDIEYKFRNNPILVVPYKIVHVYKALSEETVL